MELPQIISAEAVLKPKNGGPSYLEVDELNSENFKEFWADPKVIQKLITEFKTLEFKITAISKSSFFFSGSVEMFNVHFSEVGREVDIYFDGIKLINRVTKRDIIEVPSSILGGLLYAVLLVPLSSPGCEWPKDELGWLNINEESIDLNQIQMWDLPRLLGAMLKEGKRYLEKFNPKMEWPFQYDGSDVNLYVLDSGLTEEHPYFGIALPKTQDKINRLHKHPLRNKLELELDQYAKCCLNFIEKVLIIGHETDFITNLQFLNQSVKSNILPLISKYCRENLEKRFYPIDLECIDALKKIKENYNSDLKTKTVTNQVKIKSLLRQFRKLKKFKFIGIVIEIIEEFRKQKAIIRKHYLDSSIQENFSHGTQVIANLLSISPNVNLNFINSYFRLKYHFHKFSDDLSLTEGLTKINRLQISQKKISKSNNDKTPKTFVVNYSAHFKDNINSLKSKFNTNALIISISGNVAHDKSTNVYSNFQIDSDHFIQVGGAFSLDIKNLNRKEYYYSSKAVGFNIGFKNNNYYPPDICGFNGGPCNDDNVIKARPLGYEEKFDNKKYGLDYLGWLWCPTVKPAEYNFSEGIIEEFTPSISDFSPKFSKTWGTSFAAPQIAAVCAIILQVWPQATPAQVKFILVNSSDKITEGCSANGVDAKDMNVGLANIEKAISLSKVVRSVDSFHKIELKRWKVKWEETVSEYEELELQPKLYPK